MNDTMIEAMSQFEIPRPILRSSVWPRHRFQSELRHVNTSARTCNRCRLDDKTQGDTRGRLCSAISQRQEAPLGAGSEAKPVEPSKPRFKLTRFRDITFTKDVPYLVKDLLPIQGLVVVWGPPKCGKSFVIFDLSMHIALGRGYRGKHVQQGPVVYLALEGGKGFTHRVEAFRRHHKVTNAPFYLITDRAALVYDHKQLITEIKGQLREPRPALVVIDTLNRSLTGSENSDKDMGDYIRAADVIREAFECTVVIIHHVRHQRSLDRTGGLNKGEFLAHRNVHRSEDETANPTIEGSG